MHTIVNNTPRYDSQTNLLISLMFSQPRSRKSGPVIESEFLRFESKISGKKSRFLIGLVKPFNQLSEIKRGNSVLVVVRIVHYEFK